MSFVAEYNSLPLTELVRRAEQTAKSPAEASLGREQLSLADFANLISPGASTLLESIARRSQALTQQRFGKVMRLFAPLYLSNECINNCRYCGFSRDNPILRVTLSVEEVMREAKAITSQGFRNILLVAGEHPRFVSNGYLADCIQALHQAVPSISLEIGPMEAADYEPLVKAGAEGLVVYQETYDPKVYADMHTSGPKRDFAWRMETPERAYAAGFRRLGIGALYGLADWRREAICVAAHAAHLLKHCWKAQVTISVPRLRPCAGEFQPLTHVTDRELAQLICAYRLFLPEVGLVLSTRETPKVRNGLMQMGVTLLSAGSHTEPGGYTGAGQEKLHHTERGRIVETPLPSTSPRTEAVRAATVQFEIADSRSVEEVTAHIRSLGYEPVWKDWDAALTA
jgi:2-iminoacetate synthase